MTIETTSKGPSGTSATIPNPMERSTAVTRLIEIIARQLVQQTIQERHENLPVRTLQH